MYRNREGAVSASSSGAGGGKVTNGLRLTLTSATPVTTGDVTGASTVYLTPYVSDEIALFDGASTWTVRSTAEVSIALSSLTSGKNYDVFAYWTGSAVALELSSTWTSDTARNDAVARQNGILVKTADKTRRLVGTIRTTGTTTTEDSAAKRFVCNVNNRVQRPMKVVETTNSWTSTAGIFEQANGAAGNQLDYVACDDDVTISAQALLVVSSSAAPTRGCCGIGLDSTTTNSATSGADATASGKQCTTAFYAGAPGVGRHRLVWLQNLTSSTTAYGNAGGAGGNAYNSGITAMLAA